MPVERKVIGTDPNGNPIYAGDTPPAAPNTPPVGGTTLPNDPVNTQRPGKGGGTGLPIGGPGGSTAGGILSAPSAAVNGMGSGVVNGALGLVKAPNNYDAAGELAKSEAMVLPAYGAALTQAQKIAQGGAPTSTISSQQITAPGAITAKQIGTPDILGGDQASYLRKLSLDQAATAAASPSSAAAAMKAAGQQIAGQQLGIAAGARGADRATAKRDAMMAAGAQGMTAAATTSELAAREQAAKQQAYSQALAGVRSGDVSTSQAQTQIGAQNQQADLEAQRATAGNTINVAGMNQGADLAASQATATNLLQGWTTAQAAQNASLGTSLQAVGAQNQAQGVAANYGANLNNTQLNNKDMMMGGAGAALTALGLSDEDAKLDIKPLDTVGRYKGILSDGLTLTPPAPPVAPPGQDFLKWQAAPPPQPEKQTGAMKLGSAVGSILGGLSDEIAKDEILPMRAESGPKVRDVKKGERAPETPLSREKTPIWHGGDVRDEDLGKVSDEAAKREVDRMGPGDLIRFAHDVPMATFRYKPGVGEDDGEDVHAGTLAGALQETSPLGRLMVHEGPDGLKRVDYGPLDLAVGKGALAKATIAEQKAEAALALARSRRKAVA